MTDRLLSLLFRLLALAALLSGCASVVPGQTSAQPVSGAASGTDSHSSQAAPDYAVVFPQDSVNRIDIFLTVEAWTALQTEMEEQFGQPDKGAGMGRPGGQLPDFRQPGDAPQPSEDGAAPPPSRDFQPGAMPGGIMPGGGMGDLGFGDTSYVSSTVSFNGETWNSVGFRYSGNSTLQQSWRAGAKKISFRLDFDEFENQDPSTKNQRFYGFKQITFKSNAMDDSYLREKVVSDIFNQAGVIAPKTAFYEVYVDNGEGAQYFGLYTAVEIVDDTLIETAFSDDSGNVYKPEGSGAAFAEGTFNEESFEKQTNAKKADWSDIQALFAALHSDLRTTDPAAWRSGLEQVFDVDVFLRWLAVDTIIQNWDTYGVMAHNYYLYNDPATGRLTWIPWDNNMALSANAGGRGGGGPAGQDEQGSFRRGGGPSLGGPRELDLASATDQWPLISYLIDDPLYMAKYQQYLQETIHDAFQPEKLKITYQAYHDLIAPYVERETADATQVESIARFNQALEELIQHAQDRYDVVLQYLGES